MMFKCEYLHKQNQILHLAWNRLPGIALFFSIFIFRISSISRNLQSRAVKDNFFCLMLICCVCGYSISKNRNAILGVCLCMQEREFGGFFGWGGGGYWGRNEKLLFYHENLFDIINTSIISSLSCVNSCGRHQSHSSPSFVWTALMDWRRFSLHLNLSCFLFCYCSIVCRI